MTVTPASAATSIWPPLRAPAHSTPSPARWQESPGCRHFATLAWHQFTTSVNGHLNRAQGTRNEQSA